MARKKKVIQEDVQVVKPVADPPEQFRANGTGEGEKNDRSVIDEAQSVTDAQPLVTGKTNAQQVTQQVPPENVNAGEGYTPVVKTQESQNGGQPGDNINNPVEATTTTTTTTTTNEEAPAVQPGSKEDFVNQSVGDKDVAAKIYDDKQKGFADYGMTRDEYDMAVSHPQYAQTSSSLEGVDDNKLGVWLENADKVLSDPNIKAHDANQMKAHKAAIIAEMQKRGLGKDDSVVAGVKSPFEGGIMPTKEDVKPQDNTNTGNGNTNTGTDTNKGGASNGTENGGQSADGTTSTTPAYDAYKASNDFAKAHVTGEAGNETFNPDTKLRVGGDAYAKRLEDTRTKIANGEKVSLTDRYELMMADKGKAVAKKEPEKKDVQAKSGDPDLPNVTLAQEDTWGAFRDKCKELGFDDTFISKMEKEYESDPEAFRKKYSMFVNEPEKDEFNEEAPKLNMPKESNNFYAEMKKFVDENYKESPQQAEDRKKRNRTLRTLATIADVITSFANIWGASKGATAFKQTSLSGERVKAEKAEDAQVQAKLDKGVKLLDDAMKKDLEFNKLQRQTALEEYKAAQKAYVERMKAHNAKAQKDWEMRWKLHMEQLKYDLAVALEDKKQEGRVALRKMPNLSESHSTRESTSYVIGNYNSNGGNKGGVPKRAGRKK